LVKTYKVLRLNLVFLYVLLGFLTGLGFLVGHLTFVGPGATSALGLMEIVWFVILAWLWFFYLRIPMTITWRDDGVLEFKSPIRTTEVPVADLIVIKAMPLSWGFIRITYNRGSLRLINQITGLYELLGTIKAANPRVEITGC
jgi:hypothetical protein